VGNAFLPTKYMHDAKRWAKPPAPLPAKIIACVVIHRIS